MKIRVKLLGKFHGRLQPGGGAAPLDMSLEQDASVAMLVDALKFSAEESFLLLLNGDRVLPAEFASRLLREGDEVTVCPPMKGG